MPAFGQESTCPIEKNIFNLAELFKRAIGQSITNKQGVNHDRSKMGGANLQILKR